MTTERIVAMGDSVVLTLPQTVLEDLGIKIGDEVDVAVIDNVLVARSVDETERAKKLEEATALIFEKYGDVFKALAAGAE